MILVSGTYFSSSKSIAEYCFVNLACFLAPHENILPKNPPLSAFLFLPNGGFGVFFPKHRNPPSFYVLSSISGCSSLAFSTFCYYRPLRFPQISSSSRFPRVLSWAISRVWLLVRLFLDFELTSLNYEVALMSSSKSSSPSSNSWSSLFSSLLLNDRIWSSFLSSSIIDICCMPSDITVPETFTFFIVPL